MRAMATSTLSIMVAAIAAGCSSNASTDTTALPVAGGQEVHNTLTAQERQEGWRLLFDGKTLNGWRGYKLPNVPQGWAVEDGALTRVSRTTDLITTEQFRDFDLQLEWKTVRGGNSGIFYRAPEGQNIIYQYAPEYQLLDDPNHPDGRVELTSAGSNYALHPAPRGVVKPAGEWNSTRIVVRGNQVEHWLNGQKIVEYELGSEDWKQRVAKAKFAEWPDYGKSPQGHIGIQGDHGWVALRNVKIRVL